MKSIGLLGGRFLPNTTCRRTSAARWDRDTFVVEARGFNDQAVVDAMGHEHSDQLRVVTGIRRQ